MLKSHIYAFAAACLLSVASCFESDLVVSRPSQIRPDPPRSAVIPGLQAQATRQWQNLLVTRAAARPDGGTVLMLAAHPDTEHVNQTLVWLDRNLEDERVWSAPANEELLDFVRHDNGDLTIILGNRVEVAAHGSLRPLHLVRLRDGVQVQRWSLPLPEESAMLSTTTRVQILAQGPHLAAVLVDLTGSLHILSLAYDDTFRQVWARTLHPENGNASKLRYGHIETVKRLQEFTAGQIDAPGRRQPKQLAIMDTAGSVYASINTILFHATWEMLGGAGDRRRIACAQIQKHWSSVATLLHKVDAQGAWRYATCLDDARVHGARLDGETLHLVGGYGLTWHAGHSTDGGTAQFRQEADLKAGSLLSMISAPKLLAVGTTNREVATEGSHTAGRQAAVYRLDTKPEMKVQALYPLEQTDSRADLIEAIAEDRILIGGSINGLSDEDQVSKRTSFVAIYAADSF